MPIPYTLISSYFGDLGSRDLSYTFYPYVLFESVETGEYDALTLLFRLYTVDGSGQNPLSPIAVAS